MTRRTIVPGVALVLSTLLASDVAAQRDGQTPQRVDPMTALRAE